MYASSLAALAAFVAKRLKGNESMPCGRPWLMYIATNGKLEKSGLVRVAANKQWTATVTIAKTLQLGINR